VVAGVYIEMMMMMLLLLLMMMMLFLLTEVRLLERGMKLAVTQLALITLYRPFDSTIGITRCTEFTHYNTLSLLRHFVRETNHF
jgi:hypothetical protein